MYPASFSLRDDAASESSELPAETQNPQISSAESKRIRSESPCNTSPGYFRSGICTTGQFTVSERTSIGIVFISPSWADNWWLSWRELNKTDGLGQAAFCWHFIMSIPRKGRLPASFPMTLCGFLGRKRSAECRKLEFPPITLSKSENGPAVPAARLPTTFAAAPNLSDKAWICCACAGVKLPNRAASPSTARKPWAAMVLPNGP